MWSLCFVSLYIGHTDCVESLNRTVQYIYIFLNDQKFVFSRNNNKKSIDECGFIVRKVWLSVTYIQTEIQP